MELAQTYKAARCLTFTQGGPYRQMGSKIKTGESRYLEKGMEAGVGQVESVCVCVCVCVCVHARVYPHAQSCLTLCHPMDCSPSGTSAHGISQARILEWVAISYSRRSSWPRDRTHVSCISCIGRRVLHHCAIWKAQKKWLEKGFLKNWKKETLRKLFKD